MPGRSKRILTALASAALVVASLVTLTGPAGAAAAASPVGRLEYVGVQADHRGGPMSDILIVRGWEFDPDASINWADVRLYVDGRLQSDTRTPEDRAHVSSAHGLSPGSSPGFYFRRFVDRGTHSYCVHALDVNAAGQHTGAFVDLGCRTVTSPGQWYVRGVAAPRAKFGVVGSKPVLCTDTSAGPVTPTLVVARDGYFAYTVNPATGYSINRFGRQGDLPVCGDWNGSGDQTLGVYRSSSATFYLTESFFPAALQAAHTIRLGRAGDLPVAGDWDGDGKADIGVWRPSNRTFYLASGLGHVGRSFSFGRPGDVPLAGDWNGDGKADIGVYRAGVFYLASPSNIGAVTAFGYGRTGDIPVPGRWSSSASDVVGLVRNLAAPTPLHCCLL